MYQALTIVLVVVILILAWKLLRKSQKISQKEWEIFFINQDKRSLQIQLESAKDENKALKDHIYELTSGMSEKDYISKLITENEKLRKEIEELLEEVPPFEIGG